MYPFMQQDGWLIPENQMPIADFTYEPLNPTVFETVIFTDASVDYDGAIVAWSWDFGDGDTSFEQNTVHQYADKGTYTVTLTVQDDDGATDTEVKLVTVQNIAPNADFTYTPASPVNDTVICFNDISSDPDGTIFSRYWAFGDDYYSSKASPNHCYYGSGVYTVTLTVTDNDGAQDTVQKTITVSTPTNNPPNTPGKPSGPAIGLTKAIYTYTTNATDINGDLLYYKWNWGDGTYSEWTGPYGSGVLAAATHKWTRLGIYLVSVKVKDSYGAESAWSPALTVLILKLSS
jgi:PKD repeat protein